MMHVVEWLVHMGIIMGIKSLHRNELWGRHKVLMSLMIKCGWHWYGCDEVMVEDEAMLVENRPYIGWDRHLNCQRGAASTVVYGSASCVANVPSCYLPF